MPRAQFGQGPASDVSESKLKLPATALHCTTAHAGAEAQSAACAWLQLQPKQACRLKFGSKSIDSCATRLSLHFTTWVIRRGDSDIACAGIGTQQIS